jgi:isopenicillin-N epimerase
VSRAGLWALEVGATFLNHGSFGAVPLAVRAEQERWRARMEAQPVRFMARELPGLLEGVRAEVGAALGADPSRLALVQNATHGVATVLAALPWAPGDEILLADQGYNAVRQAVRALEERHGVVARVVHVPFPIATHDIAVEAFAQGIGPRTRLVIVDHVSSPTAWVYPVARIVALARAAGVPVLVDGAHGPGMLPLALDALGADFYTGNLHKWACAPRGTAILHVDERWRAHDARGGALGVHPLAVSHAYGQGHAAEFDWTGTFDPTGWLAVPAALAFAREHADMAAHNHARVREGRALLAQALDVALPHPENPVPVGDAIQGEGLHYASMAAVPVPLAAPDAAGWTPDALRALNARMWEEHRIEVPFTAPHGALLVRISGQLYNEGREYERLARALSVWCGRA